jgi:branched-chain amino acid transport system ATP-binding protein
MSDAALCATGMSAGYNGVPAVRGVDLEVAPGEMVALLGANGAGKSTTLLALAGHLKLLAGEVSILGRPERRPLHKQVQNGLALLPEARTIFKSLTVRENLLLGRGAVDAALGYFPELNTRIKVRAGLLSGGEQQMLGLARVLAARPKVLLADELSLGLAPLIVRRLYEALKAATESGAAVIVVEQHSRIALAWSQRAYIMRRGKIELSGESQDLARREAEVSALYL